MRLILGLVFVAMAAGFALPESHSDGISNPKERRQLDALTDKLRINAEAKSPNLLETRISSNQIENRRMQNMTSAGVAPGDTVTLNSTVSANGNSKSEPKTDGKQIPMENPQSPQREASPWPNSCSQPEGYHQPGSIPLSVHYMNVSQIKTQGTYEPYVSPTFRFGYLTTNLTIGRPQQNFFVAVETGSPAMFVFDKKYYDIQRDQHTYDGDQSVCSEQVGNMFWTQSGYAQVEGYEYVDLVSVLASIKQYFGSAVKLSGFSGQSFPFDGVLGLAWNPQEKTTPGDYQAPILNILKKMWTKAYTVYVKGSYSRLCYGTTTCAPCDWQIHYVPIMHGYTVPMITLEQFTWGYNTDWTRYRTTVDSDFAVILFPNTPYYRVYYGHSARLNTRLGILMVKCNQPTNDWTFGFGGRNYTVTRQQYVVDIGLPNGDCALAAGKSDEKEGQYHMGLPFYQSYCVSFDITGRRVGFARNSS